MEYKERIKKLNSLNEFINGEHQDDILLILDKNFEEDKWSIICAAMHWFRTVESYLNSEHLLEDKSTDYNWGKVYLFLSAVDIIIQLSRLRDKSRKTMEITEVVGYENGQIILNPLYVFEEDENSTLEKVSGGLKRTSNPMKNTFKLQLSGIKKEI